MTVFFKRLAHNTRVWVCRVLAFGAVVGTGAAVANRVQDATGCGGAAHVAVFALTIAALFALLETIEERL